MEINIENPRCIDLIITNREKKFQNTMVIETGLSDFHNMAVTILKTSFTKQQPKRPFIEIINNSLIPGSEKNQT